MAAFRSASMIGVEAPANPSPADADGDDNAGDDADVNAGDDSVADADRLPAGGFATWLDGMQRALRGEADSDVPCGTCTACCASSQFVHIGPDEASALAHIPPDLLFPAPMMPPGNVLMGYDERGRCPMLTDAGCSIYEHRPRTCRTYDCRVFPAAGRDPGVDGKPLIADRARRWRFDHPASEDVLLHHAVRAAASFLDAHADDLGLPSGTNETQRAVMAVASHGLFRAASPADGRAQVEPTLDEVRVELSATRR